MAIFHLRIALISRGRGANAIETAARYAATALIDQRNGEKHDFSTEVDVVHSEIIGPSGVGDWWRDRASLWNAAEKSEVRRDARVAREYQLGLPHEVCAAGRVGLARRWAQFICERYGIVVDVTVHAPPALGDPRNHCAKLLATTRQVTPTGLGAKVSIEKAHGEGAAPNELRLLHQRWRQMVDEILRG
jgi:hypothetical protein